LNKAFSLTEKLVPSRVWYAKHPENNPFPEKSKPIQKPIEVCEKVSNLLKELMGNFILRQIQKNKITLTSSIDSEKTTNESEVIIFVRSLSN
jgi:hypothetical protein